MSECNATISVRDSFPADWRLVRLGEVCDVVSGQVDPTASEFRHLPHVNGQNIESGTGRLLNVNTAAEDGMISGKYLFAPGDVLYSKLRPYLRKVAIVDFRGVCSADMYPLRPNPGVLDSAFFAWLLLSDEFTDYADELSRRARMPKLNRRQLFDWYIPLPPLAEQKRIAGILKEQLAAVECVRCAAQTQLEAAQSLPAAYLREVFGSDEAKTWPRIALKVIANIRGGVQKTPARNPVAFHRPYLTVRNVQRGHLDLSQLERFELTPAELTTLRLQRGDLLIVEGNGSLNHIGRNAIFEGDIDDCVHQNHIIRVRLDLARANSRFISRYLNSSDGMAQMVEKARTTSGLFSLSAEKVASLTVPLPPINVQGEVVHSITDELTTSERLVSALTEQLKVVDELSGALLRQAFQGRL